MTREQFRDFKRQMIDWAESQRGLKLSVKAVLKKAAEFAGPEASTIRGQETFADRLSCSRKTVERSLKKLEEAGLIHRQRRADRSGHRTSDRIILRLPDKLFVGIRSPSRQFGSAYPTESLRNLPFEQPILPPTPQGGRDSDFQEMGPRMRIPKDSPHFAPWVAYYLVAGREAEATLAVERGFVAERSYFPPHDHEEGKPMPTEAAA